MPTVFASGLRRVTSSRRSLTGTASDVPVTLPPGDSRLATRPASTGSVTAVKSTGMSVTACATAIAVAQAVTDIPVLFTAVTDPVDAGLVASLESPGGNVTGTSDAVPVSDLLELVTRLSPDAKTVGIVYNPGESNAVTQVGWAQDAAADLGLEIVLATADTSNAVQQAAESLDVDAFFVITDNTVVSALETLIQVAEAKGIPVIASEGDSVARGAIATIGISYYDLGYQTGEMAVKILKGEATTDAMPVETQSELAVYLNTGAAERMGVTIPADLLAEADPENITE